MRKEEGGECKEKWRQTHLPDLGTLPLHHRRDSWVGQVGVEVVRDRDDVRARCVAAVRYACVHSQFTINN
jgi:hypothetical protein